MTREVGDRAAFLAGLGPTAFAPSHRGQLIDVRGGVRRVAYTGEADFNAALTALGGVVRALDGAAALTAFVNDAVDIAKGTKRTARVVMTNEVECASVAYALGARSDVEVVDYSDAAAVATADVGFTGARGAVARTGSLVVDAGRAGGRTVSLLPPMHVALVAEGAIVDEPGDLWRSLQAPMPSNLVQITGPSRSADIELIITLGVHGPRALWVGVIADNVGV
ncbi:MAG: L-lactate dehydrogenase complex protein LldF [Actinomycetota bacterium]